MEFLKVVLGLVPLKRPRACKEGVEKNAINGYDTSEFSDAAVGVMVKSTADAGIDVHSMKYPWVCLPGGRFGGRLRIGGNTL